MATISTNPQVNEQGFPPQEPDAHKSVAPGGSKWILPPYLQHLTFFNFVSRTYFWTHDEALRSSECNAEAMWADPVISSAIIARQQPVCQLEWQLEPRNPSDPAEKQAAEDASEVLEDIPRFQDMRRCLLDAIWLGRAGVQIVTTWDDYVEGRLRIADWSPVHGDSLVFKFSGQPGIMCNPGLDDPGVELIEGRGGKAKFLTPKEQEVLLIHEFEPMAASYFRQEMSGMIHGTGMRGRVYWVWWLKHNLLRIMMDFLRKSGNGFFLAGYEAANRTELANMKKALECQQGQPVIYVPIDQQRKIDEVLKHLPVSLTGADFQWMVWNGFNTIIRDAILGETNANKSAPAGIGGQQAEHQGMTDDERVKYDAVALEFSLQKLTNLIYKYQSPGIRPARFVHLCDKRNPEEVMMSVDKALSWGLVIPKTWVQNELGIPDSQQGDEVLGMVQNQQSTALTSAPSGTPMSGPAGPMPGMQGQPGQPQPVAGQPQAGDQETAQLASSITPMNG